MGKKRRKLNSDVDDKLLSIVDNGSDGFGGKKKIEDVLYNTRVHIKCKNKKQKEFVNLITENQITIGVGPAGVGKSYLSVLKSLQMLFDPTNGYDNLIIVTPIVEADEKIGFLKGSIEEKIAPYLYSTYYIIDKIIGKVNREKLVEAEVIQPMVLAYMRGINIDNSILLFEEAQNCTPRQMKTLLTRIGDNTKFIITGDMGQSDRFRNHKDSGLFDAMEKLADMTDIGIYNWVVDCDEDIVRNPLINKILNNYSE